MTSYPSIDAYYLKNDHAELNPNPIGNNGALGFFKERPL